MKKITAGGHKKMEGREQQVAAGIAGSCRGVGSVEVVMGRSSLDGRI